MLNHWSMADILAAYTLTEAECIKCLLALEGMGIVQIQPGNRIRLMVARDFGWLPDGPLRKTFFEDGLPDFLASDFSGEHELLEFAYGMLTEAAAQQLSVDMERLREKRGTSLFLARRWWEPGTFAQFRRRQSGL